MPTDKPTVQFKVKVVAAVEAAQIFKLTVAVVDDAGKNIIEKLADGIALARVKVPISPVVAPMPAVSENVPAVSEPVIVDEGEAPAALPRTTVGLLVLPSSRFILVVPFTSNK